MSKHCRTNQGEKEMLCKTARKRKMLHKVALEINAAQEKLLRKAARERNEGDQAGAERQHWHVKPPKR